MLLSIFKLIFPGIALFWRKQPLQGIAMKHLIAIILYLTITSASNATVIWDESVDGDLLGIGQNIGSLQVGTNTFRGTFTLFRSNGNAANADTDSGFINLANNLQITSMDAAITSTYGYGVIDYSRITGLHSPTVPQIYYEEMLSNTVFTNLLPISESGTYRFFTGGGSASVEDNVEFYWDWEINIEVAVVDEPSSLLLLLTGVLSIILFGTRGAFRSNGTRSRVKKN